MKSIEKVLNDAIASKRSVSVTTEKLKTRTVMPHSIQDGILYCDVLVVSLLGDSAHNNAQMNLSDITKAETQTYL